MQYFIESINLRSLRNQSLKDQTLPNAIICYFESRNDEVITKLFDQCNEACASLLIEKTSIKDNFSKFLEGDPKENDDILLYKYIDKYHNILRLTYSWKQLVEIQPLYLTNVNIQDWEFEEVREVVRKCGLMMEFIENKSYIYDDIFTQEEMRTLALDAAHNSGNTRYIGSKYLTEDDICLCLEDISKQDPKQIEQLNEQLFYRVHYISDKMIDICIKHFHHTLPLRAWNHRAIERALDTINYQDLRRDFDEILDAKKFYYIQKYPFIAVLYGRNIDIMYDLIHVNPNCITYLHKHRPDELKRVCRMFDSSWIETVFPAYCIYANYDVEYYTKEVREYLASNLNYLEDTPRNIQKMITEDLIELKQGNLTLALLVSLGISVKDAMSVTDISSNTLDYVHTLVKKHFPDKISNLRSILTPEELVSYATEGILIYDTKQTTEMIETALMIDPSQVKNVTNPVISEMITSEAVYVKLANAGYLIRGAHQSEEMIRSALAIDTLQINNVNSYPQWLVEMCCKDIKLMSMITRKSELPLCCAYNTLTKYIVGDIKNGIVDYLFPNNVINSSMSLDEMEKVWYKDHTENLHYFLLFVKNPTKQCITLGLLQNIHLFDQYKDKLCKDQITWIIMSYPSILEDYPEYRTCKIYRLEKKICRNLLAVDCYFDRDRYVVYTPNNIEEMKSYMTKHSKLEEDKLCSVCCEKTESYLVKCKHRLCLECFMSTRKAREIQRRKAILSEDSTTPFDVDKCPLCRDIIVQGVKNSYGMSFYSYENKRMIDSNDQIIISSVFDNNMMLDVLFSVS